MPPLIFAKTKLIFDICNYITIKRNRLLEDLVAYSNDPVRFNRRIRLLKHLAYYEHSIIQKIEYFNTNSDSDILETFEEFKQEIDVMSSINT
jgi:hypothetical protein